MQGYKLTLEQKNLLTGQEYADGCFFNPVPDVNGDYFIFEEEVKHYDNPVFMWVRELTLSVYVPVQFEE